MVANQNPPEVCHEIFKLWEIYRTMCYVYREESCFSKNKGLLMSKT